MKRGIYAAVSRVVVLVILVLWFSACANGGGHEKASLPSQRVPTSTPTTAGILTGPQPCPARVQNPAFWTVIVHPAATRQIEQVRCGYLVGQPTLQAVVTVRMSGTMQLLDLHIFTHLTGATPTQIFSLTGMQQGTASISNYNTLLVSQQEWHGPIGHTLSREFKWSESAHTLAQVGFVGLYPDLTRAQAENAQALVNESQGGRGWQLDAVSTAQSFAETMLHWPPASPATVVSGGGTHDASAVVQVTTAMLAHATIQVSLSRLELNTNGGIWEVTDVVTSGMNLTTPQSLQRLASPAQVGGSTSLASGEHAVLVLINGERASLVQKPLRLSNAVPFSTSMSYTSPAFQGMVQEGILVLYTLTGNQQIVGCAMVKVLLQT